MSNSASSVLATARKEIGYYRHDDPKPGTKYGRWFANLVGDKSYGANGVPFCAMFVTWVFAKAGAKAACLPGAYCPTMVNQTKRAGRAVSAKSARPGDIVFFDWDGGVSDHVGIVERNKGGYLQTIEGNTNGGRVARRTRAYSTVECVCRPDFGSLSTSKPSSSKPSASKPSGKPAEQWWWGPKMSKMLQRQRGTKVDGVISAQPPANRKYVERADTSSWKFTSKYNGGSDVIKSVQRLTGATVDGWFGKDSAKKLQAWLNRQIAAKKISVAKLKVDGYFGDKSVEALYRALEKNLLKR